MLFLVLCFFFFTKECLYFYYANRRFKYLLIDISDIQLKPKHFQSNFFCQFVSVQKQTFLIVI